MPNKRRRPSPRRPSKPRGRRAGRDADAPGQVGRRPSSPLFLLVVGVGWVACGIVAFVALTASWKLVPAIFFVGVGALWIRGAVTAAARQTRGST
jgi:hypothetical protein